MVLSRRRMTALLAGVGALSVLPARAFAATTVRFSMQRSSTLLTLLKADRSLEPAFAAKGMDLGWAIFDNVIDAMNTGVVDFQADVADAVPIFVQAHGTPLTFYAAEDASPAAEAIIVHDSSPIRRVEDLKGKTVAVHQGSGCHFVLAAALKRVGLSFKDINAAYLKPADASAAFERGSVDAWTIWDPFLALTQAKGPTRTLCDATGLSHYRRYYMVKDDFVAAHPDLVGIVFDALVAKGRWVKANPREAAQKLSPLWGGMPADIIETVNTRRSYSVIPVSRDQFHEQQAIATTFTEAGLIPKPVDTEKARIWTPAADHS